MYDPHETIETARLILRHHRLDDFDALAATWRDPAVMRQFGDVSPSDEDLWIRLLRYEGHWAVTGHGVWAVEEKTSGHYLGQVGLMDFRRGLGPRIDGAPEIAWVLNGSGHGAGYATEAAHAALRLIEERLAPARTVCIINPENTASLRVAEKLGYVSFGDAMYKGSPVLLLERFADQT